MDDKVSNLTGKVITAIRPVTALMTFARRPLQAGGPAGIMGYYRNEVIPNWHAPTLEGFGTALEGDLGFGIINTLVGMACEYIGEIGGVGVVKTVGRAIKAGGEGQSIGGLADMVIHAHEFNQGPALLGDRGGKGKSFSPRMDRSFANRGKGRAKISSAPGVGTHRGAATMGRFR